MQIGKWWSSFTGNHLLGGPALGIGVKDFQNWSFILRQLGKLLFGSDSAKFRLRGLIIGCFLGCGSASPQLVDWVRMGGLQTGGGQFLTEMLGCGI